MSELLNLIRAGVPEAVAMRISGHKTRSVFERYNIITGRDLHDAARRLEAYVKEKEIDIGRRLAVGTLAVSGVSPRKCRNV